MLSEQPGKEISGDPKSEIDPDEPMVYQIKVKLHSAAQLSSSQSKFQPMNAVEKLSYACATRLGQAVGNCCSQRTYVSYHLKKLF